MPRIDHDSTCRRVFGAPRMVKDLFVGFVDSELAQLLDWSTLKQVAARHTSEDLHQRENDMIWELQRLGGAGPPVYLMLEFQSQPDWTMALRMWNYCGQFCETLAKQEDVREQRQLPTVLPIVVYDGEREWSEVLDVADLVGFVPPGWEAQSPRMAFVLVDVFRSAGLDRSLRNIVDAMFRLLRAGALEVPGEVRRLKQRLRGEEWAGDYISFSQWESAEAFHAWTRSESFRLAHAQGTVGEVLDGPPVLGLYEPVITETPTSREFAETRPVAGRQGPRH